MIIFGAALVVLYLVFWAWHSPWAGKLTKAEIDRYLVIIERSLQPAEEVEAFTSRVRSWAEADDGRPVYMVNLMHFLLQFRTFPGAPEFKGTPREANAYYEKGIKWLWLRHAAYPIFRGVPQARNLIHIQPERTWAETAVVRYRNRRTFLKLLSDPSYAAMEPYKFIAVEIDLVPISSKMVIPDPRKNAARGALVENTIPEMAVREFIAAICAIWPAFEWQRLVTPQEPASEPGKSRQNLRRNIKTAQISSLQPIDPVESLILRYGIPHAAK